MSLRRRNALTVENGALSNKLDYVKTFKEIINLEGYPQRITGGWVCLLVKLHWEGSAPAAACAAGLLNTIFTSRILHTGDKESLD